MELKEYLKENPNCILVGNNVDMVFVDGKLHMFDNGTYKRKEK